MQRIFRYLEPLRRGSRVWQTEGQTDRLWHNKRRTSLDCAAEKCGPLAGAARGALWWLRPCEEIRSYTNTWHFHLQGLTEVTCAVQAVSLVFTPATTYFRYLICDNRRRILSEAVPTKCFVWILVFTNLGCCKHIDLEHCRETCNVVSYRQKAALGVSTRSSRWSPAR